MNQRDSVQCSMYTVEDIITILNIGKNTAYRLINEGRFPVKRIGVVIRIPKEPFDEWLRSADKY